MNRPGRGRPVRFVGLVAVGWIGLRVALLWPAPPRDVPSPSRPPSAAAPAAKPAPAPPPSAERPHAFVHRHAAQHAPAISAAAVVRAPAMPLRDRDAETTLPPLPPPTPRVAMAPTAPGEAPVPATPPLRHDRWQASGWIVARPGRGIGAAPGTGQIGGSQYGLRLRAALGGTTRLAAIARIAGPLRGPGAEAAFGLEWQPSAAPLRLAVEQRIGLDGTRGGPGMGMVAGIDRALPAGIRLEAYGQAGAIVRARLEPYADGALRLTRTVAQHGGTALAIGAGSWGAAQRDARRLDIGPSLVLGLPIGRAGARLALDWRQRIAGDSRPGSGIALSLGSDF